MKFDGRKASRVKMDHKQPVNLMGSDGTWRRSCVLLDVSQTGAKIEVEGTLDVLQAKEFFMLLSSTGSRLPALRAGLDRRHHGRRALHQHGQEETGGGGADCRTQSK